MFWYSCGVGTLVREVVMMSATSPAWRARVRARSPDSVNAEWKLIRCPRTTGVATSLFQVSGSPSATCCTTEVAWSTALATFVQVLLNDSPAPGSPPCTAADDISPVIGIGGSIGGRTSGAFTGGSTNPVTG